MVGLMSSSVYTSASVADPQRALSRVPSDITVEVEDATGRGNCRPGTLADDHTGAPSNGIPGAAPDPFAAGAHEGRRQWRKQAVVSPISKGESQASL